jgi:Domain of unknown function (DUF4249)
MQKPGLKSGVVLITVFLFCTCIDPYTPKLKGYDSLLVVDGLITDANTSYTVRLSRTFQNQNTSPVMVSGATVFITDDNGNNQNLNENGTGLYQTDSLGFTGMVGRTYTLHITTKEGTEYVSDPCPMQSVPDIDSIYFAKDQELVNNSTQIQEGISIYLDSKAGDNNHYYRWAYEETWEFKVPYPKRFNFNVADSSITPVADVKEYCWKSTKSDEILIYSTYSGQTGAVKKEPINFIATGQSDRLNIEYSILVNQYSVSQTEYDFWNNLKQVGESGQDIFASQPYPVISNIHNVNNQAEKVLGYFQVSAVKQKRKNISFNDIAGLNLPYFNYSCDLVTKSKFDYVGGPGEPPPSWKFLYSLFCITSDYYFVAPVYYSGMDSLVQMEFTRPLCADCELSGTHSKPNFWVDLK